MAPGRFSDSASSLSSGGRRNADGKMTLAEYVDQRFVIFHEADVSSDGVLSVDEVVDVYEGP